MAELNARTRRCVIPDAALTEAGEQIRALSHAAGNVRATFSENREPSSRP
jgi:hypothetical protein